MTGEIELRARLAAEKSDGVVLTLWVCAVAAVLLEVVAALSGPDHRGWIALGVGLLGVVYLCAGIRWLSWFSSLYAAVIAAGRARVDVRGVAVWSWLLPVVDWFLPYVLVNDIWRAADQPGEDATPRPRVLKVWWAVWVAFGLLASRGLLLLVVTGPLFVVAGVLATRVVRLLTERVQLLADYSAGIAPPSTATTLPVT
jgi:hypothetical protein